MMYRQSEALVSFMQRITTTVSSNKIPDLLQVTISAFVIFKVFRELECNLQNYHQLKWNIRLER